MIDVLIEVIKERILLILMVFSFFIWQLGRRGEDWARAIGSGRTGAWRSTY